MTLIAEAKRWLSDAADVLLPPKCLACDLIVTPGQCFCPTCELGLEELPPQGCAVCSEPSETSLCSRCEQHPKSFIQAWAPFVHSGPLARAIHRCKYEDHPEFARPLAQLLWKHAEPWLKVRRDSSLTLVPIPLHAQRFRDRRYDQTSLLAYELSRNFGLPLGDTLIRRLKQTERQVGLNDQQRQENLEDAFVCVGELPAGDFLLLDDVYTTGSTAEEATKALCQSGSRKVFVLTLAHATKDDLAD